MLRLGQRPGFHDLHGVAPVRFVLLIVYVTDGAPADVLAIARVLDQAGDLHPPRFVHLVTGDHAHGHPTLAAPIFAHGATPPWRLLVSWPLLTDARAEWS